jgi:hypothetical protein
MKLEPRYLGCHDFCEGARTKIDRHSASEADYFDVKAARLLFFLGFALLAWRDALVLPLECPPMR